MASPTWRPRAHASSSSHAVGARRGVSSPRILARDLARLRAPRGALSRKCLLLSRKPSLISEIAFPGGGAVNKSGLIDAVSKTTSLAKRDAEEAVNALVHVVSKEVRSGRRVVVAGFGSFNPTHRGASYGAQSTDRSAGEHLGVPRCALCGQWDAQGHPERQGGTTGTEGVLIAGEEVVQVAARKAAAKSAKATAKKADSQGHEESRHQGHQELDHEGGQEDRRRGIEKGRRARPGQKDDARPGEESSKAIGQKGRRTSSGEESNKAIGQEGR